MSKKKTQSKKEFPVKKRVKVTVVFPVHLDIPADEIDHCDNFTELKAFILDAAEDAMYSNELCREVRGRIYTSNIPKLVQKVPVQ